MKKGTTFVIKIRDEQHETWQGSILWVEKNKKCNFRSALELIKLMDEALGRQSEKEMEPEDGGMV